MLLFRYAAESEESRRQEWCEESRTEGEVKKTKQGARIGRWGAEMCSTASRQRCQTGLVSDCEMETIFSSTLAALLVPFRSASTISSLGLFTHHL